MPWLQSPFNGSFPQPVQPPQTSICLIWLQPNFSSGNARLPSCIEAAKYLPVVERRGQSVSLGSVVLLHGLVTGMGRQAECEILARRIAVPAKEEPESLNFYTYTDCSIIGASADLPNGEYTATFESYSFRATCQRGLWLSCGPPCRLPQVPVFGE